MISRSAQRVARTAACGPAVAAAASRRPPVDAALAMLDAGGNAVDAAVACGFVAGVVEPAETCLAGSGFLLAWDAAQRRATSVESANAGQPPTEPANAVACSSDGSKPKSSPTRLSAAASTSR